MHKRCRRKPTMVNAPTAVIHDRPGTSPPTERAAAMGKGAEDKRSVTDGAKGGRDEKNFHPKHSRQDLVIHIKHSQHEKSNHSLILKLRLLAWATRQTLACPPWEVRGITKCCLERIRKPIQNRFNRTGHNRCTFDFSRAVRPMPTTVHPLPSLTTKDMHVRTENDCEDAA